MNLFLRQSLLVTGLFSLGLSAHAGVTCDSSKSNCYIDTMPLYSQNDEQIGKALLPSGGSRSMLCGPTSGAMVLQSIVDSLPGSATTLKATSWTQKSFVAATAGLSARDEANAQIRIMASKMNTSPTVGTYGNYLTQASFARKGEFTPAGTGANTAYPSSFPASSYISYVKDDKSSVILMYGYYSRSSSVSNGKTYYSYTRNGGHIVALNGFSGQKLLIYNPWYAVKDERSVTLLKKGCAGSVCENLPGNLAQRSSLYNSGSSFHIIDQHARLAIK